jgi:hypothetical protein
LDPIDRLGSFAPEGTERETPITALRQSDHALIHEGLELGSFLPDILEQFSLFVRCQ